MGSCALSNCHRSLAMNYLRGNSFQHLGLEHAIFENIKLMLSESIIDEILNPHFVYLTLYNILG